MNISRPVFVRQKLVLIAIIIIALAVSRLFANDCNVTVSRLIDAAVSGVTSRSGTALP
jgi:hypothetical protein